MRRRWPWLAAAASGGLLALAFPWPDQGVLAWVALVPLLAVLGSRPGTALARGWLAGLVFYALTLRWIVHTVGTYTALPTWVGIGVLLLLAAVLGAYTGLFALGVALLDRAGRWVVVGGAALWVALEWARSVLLSGFPWASLGYSQYKDLFLVQIVEWTGVYGISALVVAGNLAVWQALRGPARLGRRCLAGFLAVLLAAHAVGAVRLNQVRSWPPAGRLRVGLVQGNVEQDKKWEPAYQEATLDQYAALTREAAAAGADLIVWPETAAPFHFQNDGPLRDRVIALAREVSRPLLFGSPAYAYSHRGVRLYDRAYLLAATGEELGHYDKMKLVPFGEYVPFGNLLFFVHKVVEGIGDLAPGPAPTRFRLGDARFGVFICYEAIFPQVVRRIAMDFVPRRLPRGRLMGAPVGGLAAMIPELRWRTAGRHVDFLITITNDAWFGRTGAPLQHLVMAAYRAVEHRMPVIQVANTGISAVAQPSGEIEGPTQLFETTSRVAPISWPGVATAYGVRGDLFAYGCILLSILALGQAAWRIRRSPTNLSGT